MAQRTAQEDANIQWQEFQPNDLFSNSRVHVYCAYRSVLEPAWNKKQRQDSKDSALLRFAPAHRVLGFYALVNTLLMALVFAGLGWISVIALVLCFFFMSIMYPTHFALAIHGLGEITKVASSWMVTAIVGGAIMPMFMGWIADTWSMQTGFLIPLACFCFISLYGFLWPRFYRGGGTENRK